MFETPDGLAAPGQALSEAEAAFFVANGFLVKEGLLADDAVDHAMERIWWHVDDRVPVARDAAGWRLVRADRASWGNPRWARTPPAPKAGPHAGRQRIVHSGATLKLHYLGGADFLLDLVPNNPACGAWRARCSAISRPANARAASMPCFPPKGAKAVPRPTRLPWRRTPIKCVNS